MGFQIKKIVLWPRNSNLQPREIEFYDGKVNVIHGDSRTGKSSLIGIVDYCLCSSDCRIPVEVIRSSTSWFGILLHDGDRELLICRVSPMGENARGEMFYLSGESLEIPVHVPDKKDLARINVEEMKVLLNAWMGITDLELDRSASSFGSKTSIRDAAAILFQPQSIVANPDTLFYKLDKLEHKMKFTKALPYFLGAKTSDEIRLEERKRRLEQTIKQKDAAIQSQLSVFERWKSELKGEMELAFKYGLTSFEMTEEVTFEQCLEELESVAERSSDDAMMSLSRTREYLKYIQMAEDKERSLSASIALLEKKIRDLNEVKRAIDENSGIVRNACDHVGVCDWLQKRIKDDEQCPLCGGDLSNKAKTLENIKRLANDLLIHGGAGGAFLTIDRELEDAERQLENLLEKRNEVIKELSAAESEKCDVEYSRSEIDKFIGRIGGAVEKYRSEMSGVEGSLRREVQKLRADLVEVNDELALLDSRTVLQSRLDDIGREIMRLLNKMEVKDLPQKVRFDINNLSIRVTSANGEELYLNQIGSASNWLFYHIANALSIQKCIQEKSPIELPTFMMIDQPSQVYFPHGEDEEVDTDTWEIRRVFSALSERVSEGRDCQIILIEHAGENVWGEFECFKSIALWTQDGEKLIPDSWLV